MASKKVLFYKSSVFHNVTDKISYNQYKTLVNYTQFIESAIKLLHFVIIPILHYTTMLMIKKLSVQQCSVQFC